MAGWLSQAKIGSFSFGAAVLFPCCTSGSGSSAEPLALGNRAQLERGRPLAHHVTRVRGEPGAKPSIDDLPLGRGFISSRAVPLLRSIESALHTRVRLGGLSPHVPQTCLRCGWPGVVVRTGFLRFFLHLAGRPLPVISQGHRDLHPSLHGGARVCVPLVGEAARG